MSRTLSGPFSTVTEEGAPPALQGGSGIEQGGRPPTLRSVCLRECVEVSGLMLQQLAKLPPDRSKLLVDGRRGIAYLCKEYVYVYMHIYIFTYIHIYIYMYTYIRTTYIHTYIHTHIHTYIHMCIYIYIYLCLYVCAYIYMYIYMYMYICIYTYIYTYTYIVLTHTHTHVRVHAICRYVPKQRRMDRYDRYIHFQMSNANTPMSYTCSSFLKKQKVLHVQTCIALSPSSDKVRSW